MEDEPKKLTKKQRRKLAKQKELELQNVVAKENKHEEMKEETENFTKTFMEEHQNCTEINQISNVFKNFI